MIIIAGTARRFRSSRIDDRPMNVMNKSPQALASVVKDTDMKPELNVPFANDTGTTFDIMLIIIDWEA